MKDELRAAAQRLSDAIADRAAAGRSHLDTTFDVDDEFLLATKALRAALLEPEIDVERLRTALYVVAVAHTWSNSAAIELATEAAREYAALSQKAVE